MCVTLCVCTYIHTHYCTTTTTTAAAAVDVAAVAVAATATMFGQNDGLLCGPIIPIEQRLHITECFIDASPRVAHLQTRS